MHIGPLRAVFEITTVSPLIAKNATHALGSRCSILLLMSQRAQFDIYVGPADANESLFKSENEMHQIFVLEECWFMEAQIYLEIQ